MKARITHSSYVIDFLDVDFNSDEISRILKPEVDKTLEHIHNAELKDWEVQFRAIYGSGSAVRIYRKMPSYPKEKDKQITIHIPIPLKEEIFWGVNPSQLIVLGKNPSEDKNVAVLNVEFDKFSDRKTYILDCLRRAISFCFEDGFAINKVKIKAPK